MEPRIRMRKFSSLPPAAPCSGQTAGTDLLDRVRGASAAPMDAQRRARAEQTNISNSHRRSFIGGSDARIIMGSDEAALVRLWREKRGDAEPEDLSGNLIVQLGRATEELNRSWYVRNTGHHVTDIQRRVKHSAIPWMATSKPSPLGFPQKPPVMLARQPTNL